MPCKQRDGKWFFGDSDKQYKSEADCRKVEKAYYAEKGKMQGDEARQFYEDAFAAYKELHGGDEKLAGAYATVALGAKYMRGMPIPQEAANYDPYGASGGEGCATCWWYGHSTCRIVGGEVYPTGKSDFYMPANQTENGLEACGKEEDKSDRGLLTRVKEWLAPRQKTFDMGFGFKMLDDDIFVASYTNPYIDNEGEIFAEKAIDDDLAFMEESGSYPELWYGHMEGTRHGEVLWAGKMGRFAVAVGQFDDTQMAREFKEYYKKLDEIAVSQGYIYSKAHVENGVHNLFHTFEISTTEPRRAANKHAALILGGKEMSKYEGLTESGIKRLTKILSEDTLTQLIEFHERKSQELDNAGVARKEEAVEEEVVPEAQEDAPEVQSEENADETAPQTAGKEMPEWASELVSAQKETMDALSGVAELLAAMVMSQRGQKQEPETPAKPQRFVNPAIDAIRQEAQQAFTDGSKNLSEIDPVTGLFTGLGMNVQSE